MYIGEVAKLSGASPKAIRLYEELGLIPTPARKGAYRDYAAEDLERILIIKQAQRLGFSLASLKQLMARETSCAEFPWEFAIQQLGLKIQAIQAEIDTLHDLQAELRAFAASLAEQSCK